MPTTTASPSPLVSAPRAPRFTVDAVRRACAGTFDLVVAAYACAIVLWAVRGFVDLGRLTPDSAEKPLLILLVVVPIRVAIGGRSWLVDWCASPWVRRRVDILFRAPIPAAVTDTMFALLATRLATTAVSFVADVLFPPSRLRGFVMPFRQRHFAEIFAAWDSGWYFDIAHHGYFWRPDGQSSVAFFPLYP
ncbi:MAG TPA: hypothetical protein VHE33_05765, partial [Acidobacteriaceae bacterium]|nr:hypothetical protein [Acidobacteriaceae bacterium]